MAEKEFPLPPGLRRVRRVRTWAFVDETGRLVSWAYEDSRELRLMLWERWVWGKALVADEGCGRTHWRSELLTDGESVRS